MNITELQDGQLVPGDGAYRMSMDWYHQNCCDGPSVSSTHIRLAEGVSPWAFWSAFYSNPKAYPQKDNQDFSFGRAAHCLVLGDEVFSENYVLFPFPDRRTNAAKDWIAEQTAAGKTIVTAKDIEHIRCMAENLSKVPLVQAGILGGQPEVSLVWQDEATGLWIKSRPDVIQLNGQVVADLKTCASAALIPSQSSITKYGYAMQFALAIIGVERIFGVTATDAVVIFVEKTAPYHVRCMPIQEEELYWAKVRIRRGLEVIAECLREPPVPIYPDDETPYVMPPSLAERLAQEQEDGLLPNVF